MQTRATLFAFVLAISVLLMTGCSGLNGLMIEPSVGPKGDCRFTIVNGYEDDIAVKFYNVQDMSKHVHYMYVSANRQATVKNMAPGNYVLRYSKGKEWDPVAKQFKIGRENYETDQKFEIEQKEYVQQTAYGPQTVKQPTHMTFTIGSGSAEGTVSTQKISDDEFKN